MDLCPVNMCNNARRCSFYCERVAARVLVWDTSSLSASNYRSSSSSSSSPRRLFTLPLRLEFVGAGGVGAGGRFKSHEHDL